MNPLGAILIFWGVLLLVVGAPAFVYFCNIDNQRSEKAITSLRFLCVSFGAVLLAVACIFTGLTFYHHP